MTRSRGRLVGTALALTALVAGLGSPTGADPREDRRGTYTNAVSDGFADTFADPAVMRGKDGWWYAVGTTDPLREGEGRRHLAPIARSHDLVSWEHVGDAFTEDTMPSWADREDGASIWAADLRYVDGEYRLYYVVTQTTVTDERDDNAIGVATAPTPAGPWTDSGAPVVQPRRGESGEPGDWLWTYDPHHVRDDDGTQYLFYGSYYGGVFATRLDATGTRAVGEPTRITIGDTYEGAYVFKRDGWWWFTGSAANCCAGPATGYAVRAARSRSITGPYVDRDGRTLLESRTGGTPLLAQNGNRWIGTGHHAVVPDLAGQDWIAYHAIDRDDPYLDGTDGINERPMLLDRIDWSDGWPSVRGGRGPSETPQTAPTADGARGFDDGRVAGDGWRADGRWRVADGAATSSSPGTITRRVPGREVRVEADVRPVDAAGGLVAGLPGGSTARADVAPDGTLRVTVRDRRGRVTQDDVDRAPASFDPRDWHALVLEVADGRASAELSDARLGDPVATASVRERRPASGSAGASASGAGVQVDNLSVEQVARPERPVRPDHVGRVDRRLSDDFDRGLSSRWQRVRDPQVRVEDGELRWPVQQADLSGPGGDAALLLQDAPAGDWTVETVVDTSDLGVGTVENFEQGGLLVHADDDRWARLSTVAIARTRQNEFGYERPYAGRVVSAGSIGGPAGDRTWLRVTRRTNAAGEVLLTGSTSLDGRTWRTGATWTMPAGTTPRVGLFAGGATEDPGDHEIGFGYLRWYRR